MKTRVKSANEDDVCNTNVIMELVLMKKLKATTMTFQDLARLRKIDSFESMCDAKGDVSHTNERVTTSVPNRYSETNQNAYSHNHFYQKSF